MLTRGLRPAVWDDVAGQKINIQILKSITKNPEKSPRSLIFEGVFGSGKTSCARILARELNNIKDPKYDLNSCPFYFEYDSTIIGNVEKIRELRDTFGVGSGDYWQVVVFDECHAASNQAQTALLKVIEEVRGKVFFIFCSTHVHKIIPTIRSRSLELKFGLVPYEEVVAHLGEVEEKLDIKIPDDVKSIIASRSGGHMRNVHMLLDKYTLIGEDVFKESVKSSLNLYCEFFKAVKGGDSEGVKNSLEGLLTIPLVDLKRDLSELVLLSVKCFSGFNVNHKEVEELVKLYGNDTMKFATHYFGDWTKSIFNSDNDFQAGMLCLYMLLKSGGNKGNQGGVQTNIRERAAVRR